MKRRNFIKTGFLLGGAAVLPGGRPSSPRLYGSCSRVVRCVDDTVRSRDGALDSGKLLNQVNRGLQSLFDRDTPEEAWQQVVGKGEVIGLKVNCLSGRGSTHPELVDAVSEMLLKAGIRPQDIIIWDRFTRDLEDGRFQPSDTPGKIRCLGNERYGFESELAMYGSVASLICKTITRVCDGVINLPVLRDHSIAGVTISLKNIFGAIHNPNKYHLDRGDPYIPDVWMLPPFRRKVRLHICDALEAQYEGGPSFMPQWRWPSNALLLSTDPVALDIIGWRVLEDKRRELGLKSLKEAGREPSYIRTAADSRHRLGTSNPANIELIEI